MTTDLAGTEILGYRLLEPIGKGGMGSVWKARHPALGKVVAVKLLDPLLARDPELVKRFLEEARIQSRLRHENIVAIENFTDDPLAMVMEYVEGSSLDRYVGRRVGPIPLGRAASFIQHQGSSIDAERQEGPHAHAIVVSPTTGSCWLPALVSTRCSVTGSVRARRR